ncbi:MAG: hypothetical protein BWZ02_00579 [Lentisphaerae bacterium ADurb.BinA184]|nr:MAG: hypothetical protein BWZ02_00579 [Lentisphaerae bacterium ADurb.BinA184]
MSRRHAPWHRLGTLALTVCLAATALSSLAATYTWDPNGSGADTGGAGTWDASSASWYDGSNWIAWPNDTPNADKAVLGGTAGTVTVAAGTTIYVNNVNLATAAGYVLSGGDATSVLAFDGISPKIDGATTNAACSFSNLLIDTGPGLLITQNGNSNSFNLNAGAAFTGTGKVSVSASGYGMGMNLNAAEPSFVGGFDVARPITTYRSTTLNATVADSLGQGATTVGTGGGAAILSYVFGAQTPGGAGDGGPAGVTAVSNGVVSLSGTWSTSKDRFTIEANSLIRGSSARLASLTRVGAFTDYASPAGPEIILNSGAVVVNTDGAAPTNTIQSLGTTHDLLYGLYGTMNSAGFALTLGGGTPWAGLGKNANGDYTDATLQQGTVTINDAGGTVGEITLRSNGVNYN